MRTAASAKNPAQALDLTAREWCIPLPGPMKKSGKPADDGIFTAIARVPVRQCASERPQMQNGAQAVGHNDGVPVQQCATEVLQMQNGAQAAGHNDGVPVRQCASEVLQMQNGAQAVGHNDGVPVRQCASERPQMQNGAQAVGHNDGVPVRQCATEVLQMQNGAQAVGHNDGMPVQQCATERPQMQNGAQALDPTARKWYIILPEHSVRKIFFRRARKKFCKESKKTIYTKIACTHWTTISSRMRIICRFSWKCLNWP